jgi:hypothetical protein
MTDLIENEEKVEKLENNPIIDITTTLMDQLDKQVLKHLLKHDECYSRIILDDDNMSIKIEVSLKPFDDGKTNFYRHSITKRKRRKLRRLIAKGKIDII